MIIACIAYWNVHGFACFEVEDVREINIMWCGNGLQSKSVGLWLIRALIVLFLFGSILNRK
jgi:hypothetical protein